MIHAVVQADLMIGVNSVSGQYTNESTNDTSNVTMTDVIRVGLCLHSNNTEYKKPSIGPTHPIHGPRSTWFLLSIFFGFPVMKLYLGGYQVNRTMIKGLNYVKYTTYALFIPCSQSGPLIYEHIAWCPNRSRLLV